MKFTRYSKHRKKRLGDAYRRPRGLHNKQRLEKKGHRPPVKQGYMSPRDERGKKNGLLVETIYNEKQLENLDPDTHGVVVGSVGNRKKIALLEAVEDAGFTLLTGDPTERREELEERFAAAKKTREEREKEREQRQKELAEKAAEEEDDSLEEAVEDASEAQEAQKEKEEEEKDKVLKQKQ